MAYLKLVMRGCSRFLLRAQLLSTMAGVIALQSCSFVFSEAPPPAPQSRKPARCDAMRGLALADTSFSALLTTLAVVDVATTSDKGGRAPVWVVDGVVAALFLGSAVYGLSRAAECEERGAPHATPQPAFRTEPQPRILQGPAPPPAPPDTAAPAVYAAPSGGAGFAFGDSEQAATARCGEYQGRWSNGPDGPSCSWVRDQSAVRVGLEFCPAGPEPGLRSLCHIVFETSPEATDGRVWHELFTSLEAQLRQRFGPPQNTQVLYPEACKGADRFYQCLVEGQLALRETWSWQGGHQVTLLLRADSTEARPSLRISYARGAHAGARAPGAQQ
jgi:hypothetical protein